MPEEPAFFAAKDSEEEDEEDDDDLPPSPVHMSRPAEGKDEDKDHLWRELDQSPRGPDGDDFEAMGPDKEQTGASLPGSPASPIPGFEPMSPGRKKFLLEKERSEEARKRERSEEARKRERAAAVECVPPPMTARTATNVARLEELESYVQEQGWNPDSPPAVALGKLGATDALASLPREAPETMFTARDFSSSELDPIAAVEAAQRAERKHMEDALGSMSPADRAAVLAAQD